ncbi:hypothetical protein T439DRAFT_349503 [Meredithblackwellia eburnea MCA 4105]
MAAVSSEFWLKSSVPTGSYPSGPPPEQAIADTLAKIPWAGWTSQGEVAFYNELVDRPEQGTTLVAYVYPNRPLPPDGVRYLPQHPPERQSITQHTVSIPSSTANPSVSSTVSIELECLTTLHGHFPPTSRNAGLQPTSPDLHLTRYRKRWRISKGAGHQGLWFFWWGRNSNIAECPPAPAGWERDPVRVYPLAQPVQKDPVYIFGSRTRGTGPSVPTAAQSPAQPQLPNGVSGYPSAAAYAQAARQQATVNPAASYQMYAQQQVMLQHQQQAHLQQQAHAQQAQAAQAQAAQAQAHAKASRSRASAAAAAQPPNPSSTQPHPTGAPGAISKQEEDAAVTTILSQGDMLDLLSTRQLAIARFARNHDLLASVFDPWSTGMLLEGKKRKKEEAFDRSLGPNAMGPLSRLAVEAVVVEGPNRKRDKIAVEDRREKLEKLLAEATSDVEKLEEKKSKLAGFGTSVAKAP